MLNSRTDWFTQGYQEILGTLETTTEIPSGMSFSYQYEFGKALAKEHLAAYHDHLQSLLEQDNDPRRHPPFFK